MIAPAADEVHVWSIALADAGLVEANLVTAERDRYAHLPAEEWAQLAPARGALRTILGAYLGLAPAAVALVEDGKPRLAEGELEFSLAHSGGLALAAVAAVAVGVDVEHLEAIDADEFPDLVEFVLADSERVELLALPEPERFAAYYRVWTRKEAYVKATGEGIAGRPLPEVVVGIRRPALLAVDGVTAADIAAWTVADVPVPAGYAAALAVRLPQPRVEVRSWPP